MSSKLKKENLLLLYDHPTEPVFMPKGKGKYFFSVPPEYEPANYTEIKKIQISKYNETIQRIDIPKDYGIPDLSNIKSVDREGLFSIFITHHQEAASELIKIFVEAEPVEKLVALAASIRDHINPHLFQYALSAAILHRKDTRNITPPALIFSFPEKFIDGKVFHRCRAETSLILATKRTPVDLTEIPKDWTATDVEEEHRVAYFREDFGINMHHYHWHTVYPTCPLEIIEKRDRKGELFFYMHRQMLARYNFERFSNDMKRAERLSFWDEPLKEAYYPKLDSSNSSTRYPGRGDNVKINNLYRDNSKIRVDVADLKTWFERIVRAIHDGKVIKSDGKIVELTEEKGIDILGNIVESSLLSYNRRFYGDIHNKGHMFIASINDPDYRHLEPEGVMAEPSTAVRDPAFFRWHCFVDEIFQEYKATLPPYTPDQLGYPGIFVSDVQLKSQTEQVKNCKPNIFFTYWRKEEVDISGGLDFVKDPSPYRVRFPHLDHYPYTFNITVKNSTDQEKMGTVRICLAPQFDEIGRGENFVKCKRWPFMDQRKFFIELDRFVVKFKKGENVITRKSSESAVSIPFDRIFLEFDPDNPLHNDEWCACGWPEYFLIPRGNPNKEMACRLFVMVSNYDDDKVGDADGTLDDDCGLGGSYCGVNGKPYPDRRAMGYPFDREPFDDAEDIYDFINRANPPNPTEDPDIGSNMRLVTVDIIHINKTVDPGKSAPEGKVHYKDT